MSNNDQNYATLNSVLNEALQRESQIENSINRSRPYEDQPRLSIAETLGSGVGLAHHAISQITSSLEQLDVNTRRDLMLDAILNIAALIAYMDRNDVHEPGD